MNPVAYVLSTFPTLTETFVVGEILELRRQGIPLVLFALRESHEAVQQPETQALRAEVGYACPLPSLQLVKANIARAFLHPIRYVRTIGFLMRNTWRNPIYLLKTLFLFLKAVELSDRMTRQGIRHIHAHWATYPTTVALAISKLSGLPYSFTAHAWDISLIQTLLPEKVRHARFIVTCTQENQQVLRNLLPQEQKQKVYLNYHGITVERFVPSTQQASENLPLITTCGALFERKGIADLVRACGLLKRQALRFRCVIIGEGPQRKQLQELIVAEGVEETVTLTGALSQAEVIRHYAESAFFVLPCLARSLKIIDHEADLMKALEAWFEGKSSVIKDGIPNVLVEAMAMGLPVISTSISGIPELVKHEHNGLLVPPRDPVRLAQAMERLLLDPGLRTHLGRRGVADVRGRFDRKQNIEALTEIFSQYLDGAPAQVRKELVAVGQG